MRINLHPGLWMVEVTEDGWSAARMDPNTGLRLDLGKVLVGSRENEEPNGDT